MEKVRITKMSHYHNDDFDELNIRINEHTSESRVAEIADDEHNAFLKVNPETKQVVGATIVYADDWFAEIASAFQKGDISNPDVKFFLEQKMNAWISEREKREQMEDAMAMERV